MQPSKERDIPWWKKATVYQIYPRSFKDSNGDGIGDINGIIQQLDYLAGLGVEVIWLTPIYQSPQKDNGYDISDYYRIDEAYGTMDDFENLIEEASSRNISIIMDLAVNHTSTDHEWFKQSRQSKNSVYRDYYIWRDPSDGKEPNNWQSKFGGPAWKLDEDSGQYYLHLFDESQADLNWENEEVRSQVYDIMHYWLKKGIRGFRLDVINLLSKDQSFPDDMTGDGRKYYTDGPLIHDRLKEMTREVFSKYDVFTVGEMSSTTIEHGIRYTNPESQELNMVFNFHHLKVDYPNGEKWELSDYNLCDLKKVLSDWQVKMNEGGGWNALFWCNHDQPRIVSRFGDTQVYHKHSAKMLATTIHMMQGTPFIYQGEEIGMTDPGFCDIADYRDIETLNRYQLLLEQGRSEQEVIEIIKQKSRDNSRTPMQWNDQEHGGFTIGEPWIKAASNSDTINAEAALQDEDSIFYHYKALIQLRKNLDLITYGDYQLILEDHPNIFAYFRNGQAEKLLVINNFRGESTTFELPDYAGIEGYSSELLLSNYKDSSTNYRRMKLRPYESVVFHMKNKDQGEDYG